MCYCLKFEIFPQGNFEKAQHQILLPSSSDFSWQGNFPHYQLTDGFCACRFIKREGKSVIGIPEILESLLSQSSVKRVKIIWYWGESLLTSYPQKKLSLSEFIASNQQKKLAPETFYNINNPYKYNNNF